MRIARARVERAATGRSGLLLGLEDERGEVGVGEASPLAGRSRESAGEAARALERIAAAVPFEVGESAGAIAEHLAALSLELGPASTFALESALLDLLGRRTGRPVWSILRGDRSPPLALWTNALCLDLSRAADDARRALAASHPALKLKTGDASLDAIRRAIDEVHAACGEGLSLRLDAGGRWSLDDACRRLEALAGLGLEYVEDPVAPEILDALGEQPVPVAADLPLEREGGVEIALEAPAVEVLVVKPALAGGVFAALDIARRADREGRAVVVTHAMDGPVGLAAAADVALALDPPPRCSGLAPHPGLSAWPHLRPARVDGPRVVAGGEPGLGLEPVH